MAASAVRLAGGWRLAALAGMLVLAVIGGNLAGGWLAELMQLELSPRTEPTIHRLIMWSVAVYGVLVAIPFVPGVEIALAVLVAAGPGIAVLLYGVTVAGLTASYLIGYFTPLAVLTAGFRRLRLKRLAGLTSGLDGLDLDDRLDRLLSAAPGRIVPFLLRHRCLALMVLLNLPGNMLIGGGGGIALIAGLSKLYPPGTFLLTLAVAVAPLPLLVGVFGVAVPSL